MKKRYAIAAISVVITLSFGAYAVYDAYEYGQAVAVLEYIGIEADSLPRSEAKIIYKDIKTGAFGLERTQSALADRADALGIEIPQDTGELYRALLDYSSLTYTASITSDMIRAIKADTCYGDIIKALGMTKDIGSGLHVLIYAVDGDKALRLSFSDEAEICEFSGKELINTLEDAAQDNPDLNTFNATLMQKSGSGILVSCPNFKSFDIISVSITEDTLLVFADGSSAVFGDIDGELTITITGEIRESYPPQGTATKIIIK